MAVNLTVFTDGQTKLNATNLNPTKASIVQQGKDITAVSGVVATQQTEINNLSSQLDEIGTNMNTSTEKDKPMIVFISDDTRVEDLTVLAPIFEAKGLPCNFACITGELGKNPLSATANQVKELYNRGHGILSHTHSHVNLKNFTEEELNNEFNENISNYENLLGLKCEHLVYPFGNWNELVVKVARKYYKSALATSSENEGYSVNKNVLDQYAIVRPVIVYGMGDNPRTLESIKLDIDECKATNGLLIFCIHAYEYSNHANNITLINNVLDYIKEQKIDVTTYEEAFHCKKNILDVGTFKTNYCKISKTGSIFSNNLKPLLENANSYNDNRSNVLVSTPLTDFGEGIITKNVISYANSEGFPIAQGGVLFTYYIKNGMDINFQLWYPQNSSSYYKRVWNRYSSKWANFEEFKPLDSNAGLDTATRTFTTPLTEFSMGITQSKISLANGSSFPEGTGGTLTTYKVWDGTEMNFQLWYPQNSKVMYRRNWNKYSNVWTAFWGFVGGKSYKNNSIEGFTLESGKQHVVDLTLEGITVGDNVVINVRQIIQQGIIVDCIVTANNTVKVRFYNANSVSAVVPNIKVDIAIIN